MTHLLSHLLYVLDFYFLFLKKEAKNTMDKSPFNFIFSIFLKGPFYFYYIGELSKAAASFATFEIDNESSASKFEFDSDLLLNNANGSKSDNDPYMKSKFHNHINSCIDSFFSSLSGLGFLIDFLNDETHKMPWERNVSKLWDQCEDCFNLIYRKFNKLYICDECGSHLNIRSEDRIELLIDSGTWDPIDDELVSLDPIEWDWETETSTLKYKEPNLKDHLKYLREQSEKFTRKFNMKLRALRRDEMRKLLKSQKGTSQIDSPEETSQVDLKRCQEQIDHFVDHFAREARRKLLESQEETSQIDSPEDLKRLEGDFQRLEETSQAKVYSEEDFQRLEEALTPLEKEFDRVSQVYFQEETSQVYFQEATSQVDFEEAVSELSSDVTRLHEQLERVSQAQADSADSPEERELLFKNYFEKKEAIFMEKEKLASEKEKLASEKEEIAKKKKEIARLAEVALHAQEAMKMKLWQKEVDKLYRATMKKLIEWLEETFPNPSEDSDSADETSQVDSWNDAEQIGDSWEDAEQIGDSWEDAEQIGYSREYKEEPISQEEILKARKVFESMLGATHQVDSEKEKSKHCARHGADMKKWIRELFRELINENWFREFFRELFRELIHENWFREFIHEEILKLLKLVLDSLNGRLPFNGTPQVNGNGSLPFNGTPQVNGRKPDAYKCPEENTYKCPEENTYKCPEEALYKKKKKAVLEELVNLENSDDSFVRENRKELLEELVYLEEYDLEYSFLGWERKATLEELVYLENSEKEDSGVQEERKRLLEYYDLLLHSDEKDYDPSFLEEHRRLFDDSEYEPPSDSE
uniref:Carboxytransferase beta subunit n=1 Tax=Diptychocarpus strictus TaxID=359840 RepID=A0A6M8YL31_9BRAS|nr:carboxytransferase beta subunit [Diptychocarpus strictus]QKK41958.1 carboxytransferase beta subunit [Diptychocarpus strictus]